MRHKRHLAAVPALALLLAVAVSAGAPAQTAPPNLTITAFDGPPCAEIGEVIGDQISITETNDGGADLPPPPPGTSCAGQQQTTCSSIGFYISTDQTITTGDTLLIGGRENLYSELGAGVPFKVGDTITDFLFTGASVAGGSPIGNVYLGAIVDEFDTVTEVWETDNTAAVPIQIVAAGSGGCGQADLVISSFTHQPADPVTSEEITLRAVVENVGGALAEPSVTCVDVGGEECANPTAAMLFNVPALTAGDSYEVVRSIHLEVAQNYLNNAVADHNQDVPESDEQNNTATDSFTVTQSTEPFALVYQITRLPEYGTLQGFDECSPQEPCSLDSVTVAYQPDEGFVGTDSFEFQVFDSSTGLTSVQAAPVGIFVAEALDLFNTPLTIDFLGSGRGDVAMDIGGSVVAICDDDCIKNFGEGQAVKLQARPLDEYTFTGWGEACASGGSSQIVTITLNEAKTCTATFGP